MSLPVTQRADQSGIPRRVVRATGGELGRYARGPVDRPNAGAVAIFAATCTWLLTVLRQGYCLPGADAFASLCYTDISNTYLISGLADGLIPYFGADIQLPVLSGYVIELSRELGVLFGGGGPGGATIFLGISATLLFGAFLAVVIAVGRISRRPWDALLVACSPVVVMTGLINWDLLGVALAALALWAWARSRVLLAGVLLGLATAATVYPGFLAVALLIACIRGRRMPEWLNAMGAMLIAWSVVNLPVMIASPQAWLESWPAATELGSVWWIAAETGRTVPELPTLTTVLFLAALAAIAVVAFAARRRPRVAQLGYLVLWALFVTNADYRPQYAVMLVLLMALARPNLRDWVIFGAGEVAYVCAVWVFLGGNLFGSDGETSTAYALAILFRLGTQTWVAAMVLGDLWRPRTDAARVAGDDPGGGVLRGAVDAEWLTRWRSGLVAPRALWRRFAYGEQTPGTPALAPLGVVGRGGHPLSIVLPAWLAGRGALFLVLGLVMANTGVTFYQAIYHWDTERFLTIATYGYVPIDLTYRAFYPGWPIVLSLGNVLGVPQEYWGVGVATACSLIAALALTRLGGRWAALGWIFAPTAVFTMMPYSEALFCALSFWAWQRARADRWWQAAVLAGLACTVRVSGLFLLGALVVLILTWSGIDWRGRLRRAAWLGITVGMLAAYTVYLYVLTGSWSAWSEAQEAGWARFFTMPWTSIENTLSAANPGGRFASQPLIATVFGFEALSFAVGCVVVGWCLRRRLWAEASYVAVQLLAFATSYWLQSVNRAILLWFPLWIMLAHLAADPPATRAGRIGQWVFRVGWGVVSVGLMLFWGWLYYTGEWAS